MRAISIGVMVFSSCGGLPISSAMTVNRKGAFDGSIWFSSAKFLRTVNTPLHHNITLAYGSI